MATDWVLEGLKLGFQAVTPLVVGFLGWEFSKRLKDIEQSQWGNRKLVEKRIEIYDKVSPLANRLFCYFVFVGDWQVHSPMDIVSTKRELDHLMYVNRYLLDDVVFSNYMEFMNCLFKVYGGPGQDAKLRTHICSNNGDRRLSSHFKWDESFSKCFSGENIAEKRQVFLHYEKFMVAQRSGIKT